MSILRYTNWLWHYVTSQDYQAICNICDRDFELDSTSTKNIKKHLAMKHDKYFETKTDFTLNCTIQNGKMKCSICPKTFEHIYNLSPTMYDHLKNHEVNVSKAKELEEMLWNHFSVSRIVNMCITRKCNICGSTFDNRNSYTLLKHLINNHSQVAVPSKFIPKR